MKNLSYLILLLGLVTLAVRSSIAQSQWRQLGHGIEGPVQDFTVYRGKLYAACFGTDRTVLYFDDSLLQWVDTHSPVIGASELDVYDDQLIVAGDGLVASWDGKQWASRPLASTYFGGPLNYQQSTAIFNDHLVIGGGFSGGIAVWDGKSWQTPDSGVTNGVEALTIYKGALVVGGIFDRVGSTAARGIATWDGTSWSSLGEGLPGGVTALTVFEGKLVAGGWFTIKGMKPGKHLAVWNGDAWTPFADSIHFFCRVLMEHDGRLICAGSVDEYQKGQVIAGWNGISWTPLTAPSKAEPRINALAIYHGKLVIGGEFNEIDGQSAKNVAVYVR